MLTIAKFDRCDTVNSPRSEKPAFTIWFSGCSRRCNGCYNTSLWDASSGKQCTVGEVMTIITSECVKLGIEDVVLLGGEPLEQGRFDLTDLVHDLYTRGYRVWLYTGLEFDEIPNEIKQYLYTVKCGPYNETLKCDGIPSSSNQKFYRRICQTWKEISF